mmetsp:Transcript_2588/g.5029  ORF Transcript_2588/g.5029 Transcript_2588/m.5029 type:complete len:202 (+) Transcript_2588:857-1462(+)
MRLEFLDEFTASSVVHVICKLVESRAVRLSISLTNLENVFQTFQCNSDNLGIVVHLQEVTERLDAAHVYQLVDSFGGAAGGGVRDCPSRFLLNIKLLVIQQIYQDWHNVGINYSLDLLLATSSDVGDRPACLLADALALVRKKGKQLSECPAAHDDLSLDVITSNDVSDGAKRRSLDCNLFMHQKLDAASRYSCFNDRLDV